MNGTIRDSSSQGAVNDYAGHGSNVAHLGGLVGINRNGVIINSSSTASVTTKQQSNIGGLVGTNSGQIIASTSNGRVSNTWGGNVGGLVGENTGMILDSSQADGEVQGPAWPRWADWSA